jgi:PIN domain nuclease of toxin-antitoxin system
VPVTVPHALAIAKLPEIHKDPFGRILVAQATVEKMKIITSDSYIGKYNVKTVSNYAEFDSAYNERL